MKIESAAIKTEDGEILTGTSHGNILMSCYLPIGKNNQEGFVTDTGEFVDRQKAADIAFEAGQTKEHKGTLYSYHL